MKNLTPALLLVLLCSFVTTTITADEVTTSDVTSDAGTGTVTLSEDGLTSASSVSNTPAVTDDTSGPDPTTLVSIMDPSTIPDAIPTDVSETQSAIDQTKTEGVEDTISPSALNLDTLPLTTISQDDVDTPSQETAMFQSNELPSTPSQTPSEIPTALDADHLTTANLLALESSPAASVQTLDSTAETEKELKSSSTTIPDHSSVEYVSDTPAHSFVEYVNQSSTTVPEHSSVEYVVETSTVSQDTDEATTTETSREVEATSQEDLNSPSASILPSTTLTSEENTVTTISTTAQTRENLPVHSETASRIDSGEESTMMSNESTEEKSTSVSMAEAREIMEDDEATTESTPITTTSIVETTTTTPDEPTTTTAATTIQPSTTSTTLPETTTTTEPTTTTTVVVDSTTTTTGELSTTVTESPTTTSASSTEPTTTSISIESSTTTSTELLTTTIKIEPTPTTRINEPSEAPTTIIIEPTTTTTEEVVSTTRKTEMTIEKEPTTVPPTVARREESTTRMNSTSQSTISTPAQSTNQTPETSTMPPPEIITKAPRVISTNVKFLFTSTRRAPSSTSPTPTTNKTTVTAGTSRSSSPSRAPNMRNERRLEHLSPEQLQNTVSIRFLKDSEENWTANLDHRFRRAVANIVLSFRSSMDAQGNPSRRSVAPMDIDIVYISPTPSNIQGHFIVTFYVEIVMADGSHVVESQEVLVEAFTQEKLKIEEETGLRVMRVTRGLDSAVSGQATATTLQSSRDQWTLVIVIGTCVAGASLLLVVLVSVICYLRGRKGRYQPPDLLKKDQEQAFGSDLSSAKEILNGELAVSGDRQYWVVPLEDVESKRRPQTLADTHL